MSSNEEIVFLSGKRTPFGAFGGSLKEFTATELGVISSEAALKQAGVKADQIDHVIFGNVVQSDGNSIYAPRHIGLKIGIPVSVPSLGVNRLCGSGFQAIISGAHEIYTGNARIVLVGGIESMSQVPYVSRKMRWGQKIGNNPFSDYLFEALIDNYCGAPMAETAENLAAKYEISRNDADNYSALSQNRVEASVKSGFFDSEIVGFNLKGKNSDKLFSNDEHPRPGTTSDALAKLRPAFRKDGMITGGNASGMVDGAASMVISTKSSAEKTGSTPIGKLVSWGVAGVDPTLMGIGPVDAIKKALQAASLTLNEMDIVEVNEAFAPQYIAVEKELGLEREKTNVNGGAIAIGHPLGATGARITMTALYELKKRKGKYAAVSACIGGGQGIALIIENLEN